MAEKTPDTDESGIERRDILKGLGFGAMGLAGVGAVSGSAVAASSPMNAGLTPPEEDLEDDRLTGDGESPPGIPSELNTVDFVVYHGMGPDATLGTTLTVLTRENSPQVVTQAFEEGTSQCSTGVEGTDPSGNAEIRQNFSVENLASGEYVAVMTLMNYDDAGLGGLEQNTQMGDANWGTHALTSDSIPAAVVIQEFNK